MNGKEQIAEKTKAMSDLLAIALACNQTRVFSMMFSGSTASTVYWEVNLTEGHHQLTHDEAGDAAAGAGLDRLHDADVRAAARVAQEACARARATCSTTARSSRARTRPTDGSTTSRDYPILVAGRAGGYFKYPGVHYRSPSGTESTSNVLLSVLRAAGTNLTQVGSGGGLSTTTCGAIEA